MVEFGAQMDTLIHSNGDTNANAGWLVDSFRWQTSSSRE
jgi:hypothetical protein